MGTRLHIHILSPTWGSYTGLSSATEGFLLGDEVG